jgi:Domain of unknown function (DUF4352)
MHPNNGPYPPQIQYPQARPKSSGAGKGCLIAIGVIVGLFLLLGACAALLSAGSSKSASPTTAASTPDSTQAPPPAEKTQAPPPAKKKVVNGIGREYRDGKFAFTITRIKKGVHRVGDQYTGQTAQGQYVLVYVTVRNIGTEASTFDNSSQKLTDVQGRNFDSDTVATISMADANAFLKDINPGNGVNGILVYDVPQGTRLKSIDLHDSMFSGGVTVPLPG